MAESTREPAGGPYTTDSGAAGSTATSNTGDQAKDQARQVADRASQQASSVADTAKERARDVADETKQQGRRVFDDARSQLRDQAEQQTHRAGSALRSSGQQLQALAEGDAEGAGPFADYARQASQQIQQFADRVENGGFGGVVSDVERFARRRPGAFLIGAAAAGLVVGRLARNVSGSESGSGTDVSGGVQSYPTTGAPGLGGAGMSTDVPTHRIPDTEPSVYDAGSPATEDPVSGFDDRDRPGSSERGVG